MANLSAITGGGGVKSVTRYTFAGSSLIDNSTWGQSVSISPVSDTSKTELNLLTTGPNFVGGATASDQGHIGIRLASTSSVEYVYEAGTTKLDLAFEVIEYN